MGRPKPSFYNCGLVARTAAVFFDVDFTLIHPGPRFQGVGYQANCARHGIAVDPARFDAAVAGAAGVLDAADQIYDAQLYRELHAPHHRAHGRHGPGASTPSPARSTTTGPSTITFRSTTTSPAR